ncbi:unnamed protein product [Clonostachys solani]|uniref:Zn(2)-C6 fungal-type domain-containing protein n=1 Tax=Clonostachys solani TaxID=160281 RepID=A0A9N9W692_9HYPO|nr:unnamed protein product [Clonostachys solani]
MEKSPVSAVKRRRRPAKSCNPCRLRKLKCDLGFPVCGTCKRARASLSCVYTSDSRANHARESTAAKRPRLEDESGQPTAGDSASKAADSGSKLSSHSPAPTLGVDTTDKQRNEAIVSSQKHGNHIRLRLRNGRDKTRIFGPSHWIHMAEVLPSIPSNWDTKEVDINLDTYNINGNITDLVDMFMEIRSTRRKIKSRAAHAESVHHRSLADRFPESGVCYELISHYADYIQPMYRVLHMPSFSQDYQGFRNEPESASTAFIMQLALVLAIGSTFYSSDDRFHIRERAQVWILSVQSWIMGPGSKSTNTLPGLQIYILLLLSKQTTCNSGGLTWVSTGSLLTMALSMGLHHEPARFASLTPFQREMRKRLWIATLELCVQHHVDSSIPIPLCESDTVVPEILNVDDESIHTDSEHEPTPKESFTDASIQIQLTSSLALRLKIARMLNGVEQNYSFGQILELGAQLRNSCRQLSDFFSPGSRVMPGASEKNAAHFHHKFLNTLLRRYIILLHQRYMIESLDDPAFYIARKICVDAAQAIVEDLNPANHTVELLQLAAAGRGTFKGPFSLHVILVLSLELFMLFRDDNGGNATSSRVDQLDMMQGDARDSTRGLLRNLADGSKELMRAGSVSSKNFNFITAVLAETEAMEQGQCTKTAVFNALRGSLRETLDIFQELHGSLSMTCQSYETVTELDTASLDLESFDLLNWDISDLLYMPECES